MSEALDLFNSIRAKMGVAEFGDDLPLTSCSRACCAHGKLLNDQAMLLDQAHGFAEDYENPFYTCVGSNASQDRADNRKLAALRRWSALPVTFVGRVEGSLTATQAVDLLLAAGFDAAADWVGGFACVFSSASANDVLAVVGPNALSLTPDKCDACWYGSYPCVPDRRGVRGPNPQDNYYDCP